MKYKYKKWQIGKPLHVPQDIKNAIYECRLSFEDFIKYNLENKIPTSCLTELDREIVETLGIKNAKELDWDLISRNPLLNKSFQNDQYGYSNDYRVKDELLMLIRNIDNIKSYDATKINETLYNTVYSLLEWEDYSEEMKNNYKNCFIDVTDINKEQKELAERFNKGNIHINEIINNWDIFKDKNLNRALEIINKRESINDRNNYFISDESLKYTMNKYSDLLRILPYNYSIKEFIFNISQFKEEDKLNAYLGETADSILENNKGYISLEQYKILFKYATFSIKDYILKINGNNETINSICEELSSLPTDSILNNMLIPEIFFKGYNFKNTIWFIKYYGLKNLVNFNNDNKNYLTYENLLSLESFIMKDLNRLALECPKIIKKNNQTFTTEEFYSIMRIFVRENTKLRPPPELAGKFKESNPDLYLKDNVAQEIKEKFYESKLTLEDFKNNPNLIEEFGNTNIVCGFPKEMAWIFDLYNNKNNPKLSNSSKLKIISIYSSIANEKLKNAFKQSLIRNWENIDINNIEEIGVIINNINNSNYIEQYLTTINDQKKDKVFNDFYKIIKWTEYDFIIDLFKNNKISSHMNVIKLISACFNLNDEKVIKHILEKNDNVIDEKYVDYMYEIVNRLSLSNSTEISNFRAELAYQILNTNNSIEVLNKIEDIFIKNNLPTVGKKYSCFEILHPDFKGFYFENSMISPVLKKSSLMAKKIIVFSDLIKATLGSNNRNIIKYLKNVEIGTDLYNKIKIGQIQYEKLSEIEKNELFIFSQHLTTLYNNTLKGKKTEEKFVYSENVIQNIYELTKRLSPDGTLNYKLEDRIIKMFCGYAGIDTLEEAKKYIKIKIENADQRNKKAGLSDMILEKGDLVKGIGGIKYLSNILQNGSVSKEYLGASANSDLTPLDTDVSMIISSDGTTRDKISSTVANRYGPIWFVIKNNDRFITTRTTRDDEYEMDVKNDKSKLELFCTGVAGTGHYGIRTGFASSEIDYIVIDDTEQNVELDKVELEIVINGFYIPIANKDGKIIFTPKEYEKLKAKMNGLSYYNMGNFVPDKSIYNDSKEINDILLNMEENALETKYKGYLIKNKFKNALSELGLELKDKIDLNTGSAILFNTGSTGRFTNIPGDGDFDYTMQIDRDIYSSPDKMEEVRNKLIESLSNGEKVEYSIVNGDIRELKTTITDENGKKYQVEIDITFSHKTDKTEYSSAECVADRLNNMNSEEESKLVKANIIFAKKFLKSINAYKSSNKYPEQGGLGGIGVENWILQNGGSFYSAAKSFIEIANKCSTFEDFKKQYSIPNFGINHMAIKKNFYPHDNYIDNMNENGYKKIKLALNEYINNYEYNQNINKSGTK